MSNLEFENKELRKIILEMFETDKSITAFRILQIAGRENWKEDIYHVQLVAIQQKKKLFQNFILKNFTKKIFLEKLKIYHECN